MSPGPGQPAVDAPPPAAGDLRPRSRKLSLLRWLPKWLLVSSAAAEGGVIYPTFDDGPHPTHTPLVLDTLARHGCTATFFLVGQMAERHPEIVRRIAAEGHTIGNHSNSHPEFKRLGLPQQLAELRAADATLQPLAGKGPIPFRTPRGALPPRLVAHLALRGRRIVYWSYDSLDYRRPDPATLIEMLRRQPPHAGDIVLMHDDGPASIDLLETVLPLWRAAGLVPRALPRDVGGA